MKTSNKFVSVLLSFTIACAILTTPTSAVERLNQVSDNYQPLASNSVSTYSSMLPYGTLDVVDAYQIGGWAYPNDYPDTPINVHIYIINNSTGETSIIGVTASGWRQDLYNGGYGNGYHCFSYNIDWYDYPAGTYTVRAYAIDINGNYNPELAGSPKSFTVGSMYGCVDCLDKNGISGWVWKPDAPNRSVEAHIYIYKADGTYVSSCIAPANEYRGDLEILGYGNGYHGFSYDIDWSTLPEENFWIVVYAVDYTENHPSIYSGYYDNRLAITLLGMVESKYHHDFSAWISVPEVEEYCENIGCSKLKTFNYATTQAQDRNYSYERFIRESSFCSITTHGTSDGKSIEWSMYGIYNDPAPWQEYGFWRVDQIDALPSGYFSKTRCVVLMACYAGLGGDSNPDNMVNALHRKGVKTVVGFKDEVYYSYITYSDGTEEVKTDCGMQLWSIEFTKHLGLGETVAQAAESARAAVKKSLDNGRLEDWGLDEENCYIAGDANQVVKH